MYLCKVSACTYTILVRHSIRLQLKPSCHNQTLQSIHQSHKALQGGGRQPIKSIHWRPGKFPAVTGSGALENSQLFATHSQSERIHKHAQRAPLRARTSAEIRCPSSGLPPREELVFVV